MLSRASCPPVNFFIPHHCQSQWNSNTQRQHFRTGDEYCASGGTGMLLLQLLVLFVCAYKLSPPPLLLKSFQCCARLHSINLLLLIYSSSFSSVPSLPALDNTGMTHRVYEKNISNYCISA